MKFKAEAKVCKAFLSGFVPRSLSLIAQKWGMGRCIQTEIFVLSFWIDVCFRITKQSLK